MCGAPRTLVPYAFVIVTAFEPFSFAVVSTTYTLNRIVARIARHPAYHTGQAWVYRFDPRFPK